MVISLLMFSGGIDSTYALVKLLRETDDEVLVHHIHLLTNNGRHIPEATSCKNILAYCRREFRQFYFTESAIDHRRFLVHGWDLIAAGFEAGMIASSYRIASRRPGGPEGTILSNVDRWIVGIAEDDEIPPERIQNAQRCCEFNCPRGKPPQLYIFPFVSLREQVEYLPRELYEMTWSCRVPAGLPDQPRPCGECKPCLRRAPFDLAAQAPRALIAS